MKKRLGNWGGLRIGDQPGVKPDRRKGRYQLAMIQAVLS